VALLVRSAMAATRAVTFTAALIGSSDESAALLLNDSTHRCAPPEPNPLRRAFAASHGVHTQVRRYGPAARESGTIDAVHAIAIGHRT
jgi:hypothetical protein